MSEIIGPRAVFFSRCVGYCKGGEMLVNPIACIIIGSSAPFALIPERVFHLLRMVDNLCSAYSAHDARY
jgi:hypothetical protein